jgi:hypothetical protein
MTKIRRILYERKANSAGGYSDDYRYTPGKTEDRVDDIRMVEKLSKFIDEVFEDRKDGYKLLPKKIKLITIIED